MLQPSTEVQRFDVLTSDAPARNGTDDANADRPTFDEFDIAPRVLDAIREMGYTHPTDIQRAVIPLMLDGVDVVGKSQTGTGKTAAFGIPMCSFLDPDEPVVQAIVLVPTRELCLQVTGELNKLGRFRGLTAVAVYGGQPIRGQIERLESGAQIVVGTPGRVLDHLERGTLSLEHVVLAVLDECDEMLDVGFADDIDRILSLTPRERQTALFSATLPPFVLELIDRYLVNPEFVSIRPEEATVATIEQLFCEVLEDDKIRAIRKILRLAGDHGRLLVFRRTQRGVDWLVRRLKSYGYRVEGIHGSLSQQQRERVMNEFRQGRISVLVATNVAARGLDIRDVTHVLNYDVPDNPEEYVHRIGRTGRAGRLGTAITLVAEWDFAQFDLIQTRLGQQIKPMDLGLYH